MNATTFLCFGIVAVVFPCYAFGQGDSLDPQQRVKFEAASIKVSRLQYGNCKTTPFRVNCTGQRLDTLIMAAYRQRPYLVRGMPSWASSAFYDLNASLEHQQGSAALSNLENHKLVMAGVQSLLEDRCHLRFHRENQLRSGFRLVPTKGGLRLQSAADPTSVTAGIVNRKIDGHRVIEYRNYPMRQFASMLSWRLESPVVDATGAEGRYDFEIRPEADETDSYRSILGALGHFGLRLEAGKFETSILVIDRLEKPARD